MLPAVGWGPAATVQNTRGLPLLVRLVRPLHWLCQRVLVF